MTFKFLLYQTKPKPIDNENWLLDLLLSNYEFHTEASSLYLQDLDLPQEFKSLVQQHEDFFANEKRINELKQKYFPAMKIVVTSTSQEVFEKLTADPNGFAYLDLAFYLEAVQKRKSVKRHAVGDKASEQFGFAMPMNSDWQPLLEEFFAKANGGYTNSAAYKTILKKHLGEIGIKLLQFTDK